MSNSRKIFDSKFGAMVKESKSFDTWIAECCAHKVMTREEERSEFKAFQAGDKDAGDRIILGNQRFVLTIAKYYKGLGVPLEDLVMEGNIGMIRAAQRFDLDANVKFCSYAVWWIRQAMQRAVVTQGKAVTLPINGYMYFGKYRRARARLEEDGERMPTMAGIAKESGLTMHNTTTCQIMAGATVSLDAELGDRSGGDGVAMVDMLESEQCLDDDINEDLTVMLTDRILADLPERTAMVMRMRFGLQGEEKEHTLDEIGTVLGRSRERVRQIVEDTLADIRAGRKFGYVREACA